MPSLGEHDNASFRIGFLVGTGVDWLVFASLSDNHWTSRQGAYVRCN